MVPLQPPDSFHVLAASGWLDLGNAAEAKHELQKVAPESQKHPDVLKVEIADETQVIRVTLKDGVHDGSAIARSLVSEGFTLKMLKEEEVNLEHVFMGITKGITN